MTHRAFMVIALAASVTIAGCGRNDRRDNAADRPGGAVGTAGQADKVSRGDKDFVHDVALANMAEIELGKMAAERGTNARVKKFGQMMVDDHTPAGEQL
jgi:putative membrane protein